MMNRSFHDLEHAVERKVSRWAVVHRVPFFVFSLVLLVVASLGAQNFVLNGSPRIYFGDDNANFQLLDRLESNYGRGYTVMFMLGYTNDEDAKEGEVFASTQRLTALSDLTEAGWQLPYAGRSESILNYQHSYSHDDELVVESLIEMERINEPGYLQRAEAIALNEASLVGRLIDGKGQYTAVLVKFNLPESNEQILEEEIGKASYALAERIERTYPDINVYLSGQVICDYANMKLAIEDVMVILPLM